MILFLVFWSELVLSSTIIDYLILNIMLFLIKKELLRNLLKATEMVYEPISINIMIF